MPQRIKLVAWPLLNRLVYHALLAVFVGVSGNVFVHFTFKMDTGDVGRFALVNMETYGLKLWDMFQDERRLKVGLSAVILYSVAMSLPLYYAKHQIIEPLFRKAGIDNLEMSWKQMLKLIHFRIGYWLSTSLDRMLSIWLVYITFLAHNPNEPVSWLKFRQNVLSPVRILSDSDNQIGFAVFLVSVSVLASVFSLMVRRRHRHFGVRGGVLKI